MAIVSSRNEKNWRRGGQDKPLPVKPKAQGKDKHTSPQLRIKK